MTLSQKNGDKKNNLYLCLLQIKMHNKILKTNYKLKVKQMNKEKFIAAVIENSGIHLNKDTDATYNQN